MLRILWFALLSIAVAAPCSAEVSLVSTEAGTVIISVSGEINQDDLAKFQEIADQQAKAVVSLQGPGGLVGPALAMGAIIRSKRYSTIAVSQCASACAMIWLAGTNRFIDRQARVGFHEIYTRNGSQVRTSGVGNALAGAYMSELHYSLAAIEFVTAAPPESMQWLTADDARRVGIEYNTTDIEPAPSKRAESSAADDPWAVALLDAYYARWNGPDIETIGSYYAERVMFYGAGTSREQVMQQKRRFAARWPQRQYLLEKPSLVVRCDHDQCAVTGVVDWSVSSTERGMRSSGSANFVVKVTRDNSANRGLITEETGTVLTSRLERLSDGQAQVASASREQITPAFSDGKQARIAYEQWFARIPEGPFKKGAGWWAANRGLIPTPSCERSDAGAGWIAGCAIASARLADADRRRRSEPDFRAGWNSL